MRPCRSRRSKIIALATQSRWQTLRHGSTLNIRRGTARTHQMPWRNYRLRPTGAFEVSGIDHAVARAKRETLRCYPPRPSNTRSRDRNWAARLACWRIMREIGPANGSDTCRACHTGGSLAPWRRVIRGAWVIYQRNEPSPVEHLLRVIHRHDDE